MASVTFPVGVGGDGSTVTDDSNPTTGLGNGGHRTRFVPSLAQVVAVANNVVTNANTTAANVTTAQNWAIKTDGPVSGGEYSAKYYAQSAANSPGTSGYAANSLTVGTGSKSFTIQTGKSFVIGQFVVIASTSGVSNFMAGQITFYETETGIMTVNVTVTGGSGTFAGWIVALSGPVQSLAAYATLTGSETLTNKTLSTGTNFTGDALARLHATALYF